MTALARTLGAMAGRRDDGTRDRLPPPEVRAHRPAARRSTWRTVGLTAGLLLALGATAAVLATDDARYLRLALLAACWAFLVAAFLAGGRRADQVEAEGREAELRHAYEVELEREVAARAEYELHLEQQLRREAEEGMRRELADLRRELAGLADLRGDLAALGQLRGELAGLGELRAELAGLGELRADLGRIRSELSEQLSGELLIERLTMRAQAVRLPAERSDDGRTLDGVLPSGGPADGAWTEHAIVERRPESRDETPLTHSVPGSAAMPVAAGPALTAEPGARRTPPPPPVGSTRRLVGVDDESAAGGEATGQPSSTPSSGSGRPGPTPGSRHRVGLDAAVEQGEAAAPRRHRRAAELDGEDRATGDAPPAPSQPALSAAAAPVVEEAPSDRWWDSPAWSGSAGEDRAAIDQPPAPPAAAPPTPQDPAPAAGSAGTGHPRLEQILAESGVSPAPGRRRRRHRDEGEPADDVLARVLGTAPPA